MVTADRRAPSAPTSALTAAWTEKQGPKSVYSTSEPRLCASWLKSFRAHQRTIKERFINNRDPSSSAKAGEFHIVSICFYQITPTFTRFPFPREDSSSSL